MKSKYNSLVTLLPAQIQALSERSLLNPGAIGVGQTGSTLHIDTGRHIYDMDARGNIFNLRDKD